MRKEEMKKGNSGETESAGEQMFFGQMHMLQEVLVPDEELIQKTKERVRNADKVYKNLFLILSIPIGCIVLLVTLYYACYALPTRGKLEKMVSAYYTERKDYYRNWENIVKEKTKISGEESWGILLLKKESCYLSEKEQTVLLQSFTKILKKYIASDSEWYRQEYTDMKENLGKEQIAYWKEHSPERTEEEKREWYEECGEAEGLSQEDILLLCEYGKEETSSHTNHSRIGLKRAGIEVTSTEVCVYKNISLQIYKDRTSYLFKKTKKGWRLVEEKILEI